MTKDLFVKSIEAIQAQNDYDISVAEHLNKAFPECFTASLLPNNQFIQKQFLDVLAVAMDDTFIDEVGNNWITYYCWELEFGKLNDKYKATHEDGTEIPLSNAGELWEYLNQKK